ncbi:MAG TPA: undecaprenyl diphosphate synthase family protein, partial [Cyclobacteriaceae bacterium]|nr:undecaprenyl diphosphate synthase family protein [Cyclobacteriaceae bacterium]
TQKNSGLILQLALNYSGRWEITEAVKKIAEEAKAGLIKPEEIDEQYFATHLKTKGVPDPELLIRTSGELRVSNFLL